MTWGLIAALIPRSSSPIVHRSGLTDRHSSQGRLSASLSPWQRAGVRVVARRVINKRAFFRADGDATPLTPGPSPRGRGEKDSPVAAGEKCRLVSPGGEGARESRECRNPWPSPSKPTISPKIQTLPTTSARLRVYHVSVVECTTPPLPLLECLMASGLLSHDAGRSAASILLW
jgi:hypothetical protein